jgi:hypothetical protein
MSWDNIQAIIGRAIVDATFRHQLLTNPETALHDEPLTPEEAAVLQDIHATTLDDFARQVLQRMGQSTVEE